MNRHYHISEGNFKDMKEKKNWLGKVVLLIAVIAAVAVYFLVPGVNKMMNKVFAMFASGDFTVVRDFVASYGAYAAVISFLLMIFQSIAAPLPAFLLTFANANLFGWWQGAILSWTSAMAGAAVCFYIARILGRDVAEKLTSKSGLAQIDTFFERYGKNTILICRLLPFISFDIVSYAAGLTSMSFMSFFIATGIGQLPATIVYSYVGGMLTGGAKLFVTALMILFALSALIFMLRKIYMDRQSKKEKGRNVKWILLQSGRSGEVWNHWGKSTGVSREVLSYYNAVFEEGALTAREKSLIALAVAHTVQCPYCIDAYTNDCLNKGVTEEQMTEAVHVAAAIRGGASLVHGVQMKNIVKKLEF